MQNIVDKQLIHSFIHEQPSTHAHHKQLLRQMLWNCFLPAYTQKKKDLYLDYYKMPWIALIHNNRPHCQSKLFS